MNIQEAVPRTTAWRWGLFVGVINGVVLNGASILFGNLASGASGIVAPVINITIFGISLLLCGYAGYITARKSGNPATGQSAGFYAGLVTAIITAPLAFLLLYNGSQAVRQLVFLFLFSTGCTFVVYVALALVAGVIGGKLAQRRGAA